MTTSIINPTLSEPAADGLQALRDSINGVVWEPGSDGYEQARLMTSFRFDRRPLAVVRPACTEDVAQAVRWARAVGIAFSVKGGGHTLAGHSVIDDALVIDLGGMRDVWVDPTRRTARVQAGAHSGDIAAQAQPHGLALSTGDTRTVGIGGLATGGGIGWLVRKHGLTIDSMVAASVVTADGCIVRASQDEHPDLFWALRGGGGNFGIVTEFEFRLAEVGAVYGGAILLPATPEVIRGLMEYAPRAEDALTVIAQVMYAPPAPFIPESLLGQLVLMVGVCVAGDQATADRVLAPIRALATPLVDAVAPMPYPGIFALMEMAEQRHGAIVRAGFADTISDETIEAILEAMNAATSPMSMVQLRGLGGAFSRVAASATAFAHRDRSLFFAVIALWMDPAQDEAPHVAWAEQLWATISRDTSGCYVNFLQEEGEARRRAGYSEETYRRLQSVKAAYDPENRFRFNQNIAPSR